MTQTLVRSHLVDPQLSYNDVVHCGGHFLPRVVIVALLKDGMNGACRGMMEQRRVGSQLVRGVALTRSSKRCLTQFKRIDTHPAHLDMSQ